MITSFKKCLPRGYRKEYILGWSATSESLYQEFLETGDQEVAEELLHSFDAARRKRCVETVESLDLKTSKWKAWFLLRKLGGGNFIERKKTLVTQL